MVHALKPIVWTGVIWIGLASSIDLFAGSSPEKIYRKVLPSVMTLEVENSAKEHFVASGVLALGDDIAVTAWHVVSDARTVWAVFADGLRVKVEGCIDRDIDRDLALLKLERPLPGRRQAVLLRQLQPVATRVYVIGAPKGYDFSITDGLVSQIRRVDGVAQYQVSCPISPGNSGGPVLNDRGEVIGIASWTKSDAQNLSFAIPSREIAHLQATRPMVSWDKLTATATAPVPARIESAVAATDAEKKAAPGYDDLRKRLEGSAGKRVTVVVQEEGKEDRYTFTVPPPPPPPKQK